MRRPRQRAHRFAIHQGQSVPDRRSCARIGAIHSVVFGGFAAPELAKRIDDAKPRLIVSASCGIEPGRVIAYKPLLDEAIELSSWKPQRCIILQRRELKAPLTPERDRDWNDVIDAAAPADCVPVEATDPLYILYTSGTTGHGVTPQSGAVTFRTPTIDDPAVLDEIGGCLGSAGCARRPIERNAGRCGIP